MPPRRAAVRRPKRRVRLETDERRAQLLALARSAFSHRAYDDVSIDDLAREAKISKGLLYHYFPTKRDLYVAGLSQIADELVAAVTDLPPDAAPLDRMRTSLHAYLEHIARHGRAFVSLMRGGIGSDPEVAEVIDGVRSRLFDQFMTDSSFVAAIRGDVRFETLVRGWIGFVEATSIDWCANPRLTREQLVDLLVQILVEIMKAVPLVLAR